MTDKTRLFFVVDGQREEDRTNNEIFTTLEKAKRYARSLTRPTIRVAIVKNAYKDGKQWNYEDMADTFQFIYLIEK